MKKLMFLLVVLLSISFFGCSSKQECTKNELNMHLRLYQKEKVQQCLNQINLTETEKKEYKELLSLL